jgi:hypothetical protein
MPSQTGEMGDSLAPPPNSFTQGPHGHHSAPQRWSSGCAGNELPANGTPSLLYVFNPDRTLGARACSNDGRTFAPGTRHYEVPLEF